MIAIPYADVLRGAAQLVGFDAEALPLGEGRRLRDCISRRLETGWQTDFWPALMLVEERLFAPAFVSGNGGSSYAVGTAVWFGGSRAYYQALRAAPNNQAPATLAGGVWAVNGAYWAAAAFSGLCAPDWNATTTFLRGELRRSLVDGGVYQLFAASSLNEEPSATAGSWGLRSVLDRTVDYDQSGMTAIGEVAGVWDLHPDRDARRTALNFKLRAGGLTVLPGRAGRFVNGVSGSVATDPLVSSVWVEFRLRAPVLFGEMFDGAAVYAAGDQVFYGSETAGSGNFRGDFFECLATTSAGESPETTAGKWSRVEIPRFLRRYLERGAAADYLRGEGDGPVLEADAAAELDRQLGLFRGEQSQGRETEVLAR